MSLVDCRVSIRHMYGHRLLVFGKECENITDTEDKLHH